MESPGPTLLKQATTDVKVVVVSNPLIEIKRTEETRIMQ